MANIILESCGLETIYHVEPCKYPKTSEEVFWRGYDTAGNYHWHGTETGHHVILSEERRMNYGIIDRTRDK